LQHRIAIMRSLFSNALSGAVAKHIDLSVTRREALAWLTLLITGVAFRKNVYRSIDELQADLDVWIRVLTKSPVIPILRTIGSCISVVGGYRHDD